MKSSCLIIAGEKSGEEHALTFLPELMQLCPQTHFWGVGGKPMQQLGVHLLFNLEQFSSWGISEVFEKIPFYIKANKTILAYAEQTHCQTAILIDFQTFNLKLATQLKKRGVRVLYYVAPQAWAWKEFRVKTLRQTVHTLFTILPFEKKWFFERGVQQVRAIPHPIMKRFEAENLRQKERPLSLKAKNEINLLLLPGSRIFEVTHLLPIFLETVKRLNRNSSLKISLSLVKASSVPEQFYGVCLDKWESEVKIYRDDQIVAAMEAADLCLAASGTVTLICALFSLPTLVCYKASLLTEFVYDFFISYRGYISLANIVHQEEVFPEFIQDQVDPIILKKQIDKFINDEDDFKDKIIKLRRTKALLEGESFSVPAYMGQIINDV